QQRVACLWSAAWPAWQASAPLGLALVGSVAIFHTRSLPNQAARPGVSREKADRIPSRSFNMAVKRRYATCLLGLWIIRKLQVHDPLPAGCRQKCPGRIRHGAARCVFEKAYLRSNKRWANVGGGACTDVHVAPYAANRNSRWCCSAAACAIWWSVASVMCGMPMGVRCFLRG